MSVELDDSVSPADSRRAEVHRERAEAIEGLRDQIKTLEEREPELKQEIVEFEKSQRTTLSELVELRKDYSRALSEAKRNADEADEKLKALADEHHVNPEETLPLVEQRFQPLIDAEGIGATVEQAKTRLARHRLALLDSEEGEP